jgi:hypothetical protein
MVPPAIATKGRGYLITRLAGLKAFQGSGVDGKSCRIGLFFGASLAQTELFGRSNRLNEGMFRVFYEVVFC